MRDRTIRGSLAALLILCAPAAVAQDPQGFADTAGAANIYEIETSKVALGASQAEPIRAFAEQMIADHTAAGEKMVAAAQADGVTVPVGMSEKQQAEVAKLSGLTGAEFDAAYVEAQVAAHDEAVTLFAAFAAEAPASALRDFAAATLPTLREHQEHAQHLEASE